MTVLIEIIGWTGSLLVVVSLAQARAVRLHLLNVIAALILTFYNGVLEVYPGVGLNAALCAVNIWRLLALRRERRLDRTEVVEHVG